MGNESNTDTPVAIMMTVSITDGRGYVLKLQEEMLNFENRT